MAAETIRHSQFRRLLPHVVPGVPVIRKFSLAATFGEAGDILEIGLAAEGDKIGANCAVACTGIDTGTAHVFSLELVSDEATPTVKTVIDGAIVGRTGGGIARSTKTPATEDGVGFIVPANNKWTWRLICDTAATTQEATATVIVFLDYSSYRDSGELTE